MRYFLPDSQDLVDPSFDFETEGRSRTRIRQRDDQYAHELFDQPAFDGVLVSKGIVDSYGGGTSRYSMAQRHRLLRVGAPEFFRVENAPGGKFPIMGDCGAFTYVKEDVPPYSVDDVIAFYLDCQFDYGLSLDHVIVEYRPEWDQPRGLDADSKTARDRARARQKITLELAAEFLARVKGERLPFVPMGVAQGWSPKSYAHAVEQLQKMGYTYIALGGMVPLKTTEIIEALSAVGEVRKRNTAFHLLGLTRTERLAEFAGFGVTSFDSTSPLRQAFKDDKDNYYTDDRPYAAIRIPQVQGNPKLERSIRAGKVSQPKARALEQASLDVMRRFAKSETSVGETLDVLIEYDEFFANAETDGRRIRQSHRELYRRTLEARPWEGCPCAICRTIGHHVILFRGAERNRRRGLHNTWVFYRKLKQQLREQSETTATQRKPRAPAKAMEASK